MPSRKDDTKTRKSRTKARDTETEEQQNNAENKSADDGGNGADKDSKSASRRRRRSSSSKRRSRRSRRRKKTDSRDSSVEEQAKPKPRSQKKEDSSEDDSSKKSETKKSDGGSGKEHKSGRSRGRRKSTRNKRHREDTKSRGEMGDDDYNEARSDSGSEKYMLINVVEEQEVRIAVVTDGKLEQLHQERTTTDHIVGNIYKGVVVNLVPNIEAAFVEFGYRKHGFLHISDILASSVGASRRSDDIRDLLKEGQEITIQVTKEGIGDKGPSLTTYLSLPGRYMVLMPGLQRRGVSRRIPSEDERSRLRKILAELECPDNMGVIARTAGEGRSEEDLQQDLDYLLRLWHAIGERSERSKAPALIYQESDPVTRVIRDVFTEDTRKIVVDSPEVFEKVKEFLRVVLPRHVRKAKLHEEPDPLFHHYGVESEIEAMHSRTVELPSGGSIVLDQTEAMVTIDVNSGTYKGRGDAEETAYHINMGAATEIARQIRLRDLGGVIAIDFIDMENAKHRADVERTLWNAFKDDRARMRMLKMSAFCIVELTRQRQRQSLRQSAYKACPSCRGTGLVKSQETLALQALRQIKHGLDHKKLHHVELAVGPEAANYMNNKMRKRLAELEDTTGKQIRVMADPTVGPGMHEVKFFDSNDRQLTIK